MRGEWKDAKTNFYLALMYIAETTGMEDVYNFLNQHTPEPLNLDNFLNDTKAWFHKNKEFLFFLNKLYDKK